MCSCLLRPGTRCYILLSTYYRALSPRVKATPVAASTNRRTHMSWSTGPDCSRGARRALWSTAASAYHGPVNAKTLAVLEFDKIRRRLADHTSFSGGRRLALDLVPVTDPSEVSERLDRTAEARDVLDRRGGP